MKTRIRPCCGKKTFANEDEARRYLGRQDEFDDVERCHRGAWHFTAAPRPGLAPMSKKRQKEYDERRAMVDLLWPDGPPKCIVQGCPRLAVDVHEPLTRGRGGSITDPDNAVPVCRPHHDDVTFGEPEWAYEQGLLIHSWDDDTVAEVAEKRRAFLSEAVAS